MASSRSITRLHAVNNSTPQGVTQPAPVKTDNLADSEPDLLAMQTAEWQRPARGFVSPGSSRLDGPAIMGAMRSSVPGDRGGAFADLAARDSAAVAMRTAVSRWQAQQARRGGAADHGVRVQI